MRPRPGRRPSLKKTCPPPVPPASRTGRPPKAAGLASKKIATFEQGPAKTAVFAHHLFAPAVPDTQGQTALHWLPLPPGAGSAKPFSGRARQRPFAPTAFAAAPARAVTAATPWQRSMARASVLFAAVAYTAQIAKQVLPRRRNCRSCRFDARRCQAPPQAGAAFACFFGGGPKNKWACRRARLPAAAAKPSDAAKLRGARGRHGHCRKSRRKWHRKPRRMTVSDHPKRIQKR